MDCLVSERTLTRATRGGYWLIDQAKPLTDRSASVTPPGARVFGELRAWRVACGGRLGISPFTATRCGVVR
jgi:hypothetical protein